jgi:hypothetical protein
VPAKRAAPFSIGHFEMQLETVGILLPFLNVGGCRSFLATTI